MTDEEKLFLLLSVRILSLEDRVKTLEAHTAIDFDKLLKIARSPFPWPVQDFNEDDTIL